MYVFLQNQQEVLQILKLEYDGWVRIVVLCTGLWISKGVGEGVVILTNHFHWSVACTEHLMEVAEKEVASGETANLILSKLFRCSCFVAFWRT